MYVVFSRNNCFWLLLELNNLMVKWLASGVSGLGGLLQMAVCWHEHSSFFFFFFNPKKSVKVEEFSTGSLARWGGTTEMCLHWHIHVPVSSLWGLRKCVSWCFWESNITAPKLCCIYGKFERKENVKIMKINKML